MEARQRLQWLDTARGIGMILVVAGHAATTAIREDVNWVWQMYNYIFYIHMPFLFLLSGYSFRISRVRYEKTKFQNFLFKKARGLVLPYFATTILVYVIFELLNRMPLLGGIMERAGYGHRSMAVFLIEMLIGNNYFSIHLWYIYVLFFYNIITYLLLKTKLGDWTIVLAAVVLGAVYMFATPAFSLAYANGCRMYLWFAAGLLMPSLLPVERCRGKISIACFVMWNVLYAVKRYFHVESDNYFLWIPTVFMASGALLGLAQWLKGRCRDMISYLGEHSMCIYLFHQPFWGSCFGSLFYGVLGFPAVLVVSASCVLSLAVPLAVYRLFGKHTVVKKVFNI